MSLHKTYKSNHSRSHHGARQRALMTSMTPSMGSIHASDCSSRSSNMSTSCNHSYGASNPNNCQGLREPRIKCSLDDYYNPFRLPEIRKPSWLLHCGKVLRYYAYYEESIPESPIENYRIHQVEIRYFLDDGTIEVYEPKILEASFPQGRLIRRHRIPMNSNGDYYYGVDDLEVGCQIHFYGKDFFITGVDEMTREFLNRSGRSVRQYHGFFGGF